jgi:hypothetical protein
VAKLFWVVNHAVSLCLCYLQVWYDRLQEDLQTLASEKLSESWLRREHLKHLERLLNYVPHVSTFQELLKILDMR